MSDLPRISDLTYVRFRRLAAETARAKRQTVEMVFEPIGLMLQPEGSHFDYFCTPLNSITVAATGGDGVHFGLLQLEPPAPSPVVMTVPMSDAQNVVVAEDFHEFLRLGYHVGFFSLEQFVYDWDDAARFHSQDNSEMGRPEMTLLRRLRDEFRLEPIPDVGAHVYKVNQRYSGLLQLPDFEEWSRRRGV